MRGKTGRPPIEPWLSKMPVECTLLMCARLLHSLHPTHHASLQDARKCCFFNCSKSKISLTGRTFHSFAWIKLLLHVANMWLTHLTAGLLLLPSTCPPTPLVAHETFSLVCKLQSGASWGETRRGQPCRLAAQHQSSSWALPVPRQGSQCCVRPMLSMQNVRP